MPARASEISNRTIVTLMNSKSANPNWPVKMACKRNTVALASKTAPGRGINTTSAARIRLVSPSLARPAMNKLNGPVTRSQQIAADPRGIGDGEVKAGHQRDRGQMFES